MKISALAVGSLALLASCNIHIGGWSSWSEPDVWVEHTQTIEIDADRVETASYRTHNGKVVVTGAEGDSDPIVLQVTRRAGGDDEQDAREALRNLRLVHEVDDGDLVVRTEWDDREDNWQAVIHYEVVQPARIATRARVHNGAVKLTDMAAPVRVETHNGSAKVSGAIPRIELETHNGVLEASVHDVDQVEGSITAHNGTVRVVLDESVSTRLHADTHNGSIRNSLPLAEEYRGDDHLAGRLGDGRGKLRIRTHNGTIRIQ